MPNFVRGGFETQMVKIHPYSPSVSEKARKHADQMKARMEKGEVVIFVGPMKDNKGNTVVPAGVKYGQHDKWTQEMHFLVEGINGSLPV
jgi:basic membrane protein A